MMQEIRGTVRGVVGGSVVRPVLYHLSWLTLVPVLAASLVLAESGVQAPEFPGWNEFSDQQLLQAAEKDISSLKMQELESLTDILASCRDFGAGDVREFHCRRSLRYFQIRFGRRRHMDRLISHIEGHRLWLKIALDRADRTGEKPDSYVWDQVLKRWNEVFSDLANAARARFRDLSAK